VADILRTDARPGSMNGAHGRGEEEWLDCNQHEGRLEDYLSARKQVNDRTNTTMKTTHTPAFAALRRGRQNLIAAALVGALIFTTTIARAADPLPSWKDGATKKSITDFVTKVTKEGSPDFVSP